MSQAIGGSDRFKELAVTEVASALRPFDRNGMFSVTLGEMLVDEPDEHSAVEVKVQFKYGNCQHEHLLIVGWNPDGELGLEADDGELRPITTQMLLGVLYLDLALKGLDDVFLS